MPELCAKSTKAVPAHGQRLVTLPPTHGVINPRYEGVFGRQLRLVCGSPRGRPMQCPLNNRSVCNAGYVDAIRNLLDGDKQPPSVSAFAFRCADLGELACVIT